MKTILTFLRKEFAQMRRDPNTLRLMIIGPIMQLVIFGYAANLDVNNIPIVVCDLDNSVTSRELLSHFTQSGYFSVVHQVGSLKEIDAYLDRGTASLSIDIPHGFGDDIAKGRQTQLQVIADGSESNAASVGLSYVSQIVAGYSQNILLKRFARMGAGGLRAVTIQPEVRVWYNPALKSRNFLLPGILALLLMTTTMMLTSLAIVKEKEIGTLEQLLVTPMKPYQMIVGKLLPYTIIAMINAVIVLIGVVFWFGVPVRGSVLLLLGLCLVFLIATLGLGLFVSTISKTQQQAMMTAMFFVMMPMNFLSGFIFPIDNMPHWVQIITYAIPLRYFFIIIRAIFLRGVGFAGVWKEALSMFVLGVAILSLAVARFHKRLG